MSMRGFSLVETVVAIGLLALLAGAGVAAAFGIPSIALDGARRYEATMHADARVTDLFRTWQATGPVLLPPIGIQFADHPDRQTVSGWMDVSWIGTSRRTRIETMAFAMTDPHALLGPCDPFPTVDWWRATTSPASSFPLSPSGLLAGFPNDRYRVSALAWDAGTLAVAIGQTGLNGSPAIFFLPLDRRGRPGRAVAGFDNAPTSRFGFAALAAGSGHVYAANSFGGTGICSGPCAQLHWFSLAAPADRGFLSLPTSSPPFALRTDGDRAGATAVAHAGSLLLLGLERTAEGMEFNVLDLADPRGPVWRSGLRIGRSVNAIAVEGTMAFVATDDPNREVVAVDISIPSAPRIAGTWNAPGSPGFGVATAVVAFGDALRVGRAFVNNAPELSALSGARRLPLVERVSHDLGTQAAPDSVRALAVQDSLVFALTMRALRAYDWRGGSLVPIAERSLPNGFEGHALACVGGRIIAGIANPSTGEGALLLYE